MEQLIYKMDLPRRRDQVWQAWTTPDGLSKWLCSRARVAPVVGGRFELFFSQDELEMEGKRELIGRVFSIDRPRLLQFGSQDDENPFEVSVALIPTLDGTRLEITHTLTCSGPNSEALRKALNQIWMNALEKMRGVI